MLLICLDLFIRTPVRRQCRPRSSSSLVILACSSLLPYHSSKQGNAGPGPGVGPGVSLGLGPGLGLGLGVEMRVGRKVI